MARPVFFVVIKIVHDGTWLDSRFLNKPMPVQIDTLTPEGYLYFRPFTGGDPRAPFIFPFNAIIDSAYTTLITQEQAQELYFKSTGNQAKPIPGYDPSIDLKKLYPNAVWYLEPQEVHDGDNLK